MTFTEAAAQVLRLVGKPLHYKEITDVAIERNLLSHVGKSPEVTMGARLAALVKKADKENPLVRVKPGVFALREWDKKTIDKGLKDRTPAIELASRAAEVEVAGDGSNGASVEIASAPLASAPMASAPLASEPLASAPDTAADEAEDGEDARAPDQAERERAAIAASAADLFEAEDDDDVPIMQAPARNESGGGGGNAGAGDDSDEDGQRRGRRRRRRRGRERERGDERSDGGMPGYTVSDAPLDEVRAVVAEAARDDGSSEPLEELSGKPLADALERLLLSQDRSSGTISNQRLADIACRKGRAADATYVAALLLAAARADNLRRTAESRRVRFRVSGQRLGLTEWAMDGELLRIEKELDQLVLRHREASRKLLARKISELPSRALSELVITLLERVGVSGLLPVQRAGAPASELHLSGTTVGPAAGIPTAIVLRRDGREIGRERVLDLRGALHHYGPAAAGMLITTGQVLSGAREEAQAAGAAPVTLVDGATLATWCESHGLAVTPQVVRLGVPDLELFDALRAG
ncbi:MAG TPA: HTH domain-containing protein [Polyangiaceae bacterium]|nr:HTH domain-containing protein [Polyangiaceae bacterium]